MPYILESSHILPIKIDSYQLGANLISMSYETHRGLYQFDSPRKKSLSDGFKTNWNYKTVDSPFIYEFRKYDSENALTLKSPHEKTPYYETSNSSSQLDYQKEKQEEKIRDDFEKKIFIYLKSEDIETGSITEADELLNHYLNEYNDLTQSMLSFLFKKNIKNIDYLCNLLLLMSRIESIKLNRCGHVIAMAGLNHKSDDIKESALRLFESFADQESLEFLEMSKTDAYWLQEYKEEIISSIKQSIK